MDYVVLVLGGQVITMSKEDYQNLDRDELAEWSN